MVIDFFVLESRRSTVVIESNDGIVTLSWMKFVAIAKISYSLLVLI